MTGDISEMVRITRADYPEIVQAARWMDEDNGTPHFEPGVGFIVDDPDGLDVPARWVPHLSIIEAALAGLDHAKPHPLDKDTGDWLAEQGKEPTLYESAVHCFVSGEYTPVMVMANSTRELFIANRFFNERFEGWEFDPGAEYVESLATPAPIDALTAERDALAEIRGLVRECIDLERIGAVMALDAIDDVAAAALAHRDGAK